MCQSISGQISLSTTLFMTRAYLPNCMNGEATYRLMMQHEPLYTLLEKLAFVPGGNPCQYQFPTRYRPIGTKRSLRLVPVVLTSTKCVQYRLVTPTGTKLLATRGRLTVSPTDTKFFSFYVSFLFLLVSIYQYLYSDPFLYLYSYSYLAFVFISSKEKELYILY